MVSTNAVGGDFILSGEMGVWKLEGQKNLKQICEHLGTPNTQLSPNGELLFVPNPSSRSSILNLKTGKEICQLDLQLTDFTSFNFIDQQRLVAIRYSGVSEIWSAENGSLVAKLLPIKNSGYAIVTDDGFVKSNQVGLDSVAFGNGEMS